MKIKQILPVLFVSAILMFFSFGVKADVATNFWKLVSGKLTPNNSTQGLRIPSLASCNTIDTNASGTLACGTDEGGASSTYPGAGIAVSTGSTWATSIATSTYNNTNWDTAYGWGNHATEGYLKTETDPIFTAASSSFYNSLSDLQGAVTNDFHNLGGTDANTTYTGGDFLTLTGTDFDVDATTSIANGDTTHLASADVIYDFVTGRGYLTAESDPIFVAASSSFVTGTPWTGMGYLTSLSGAVLTDQTSPQTIGATGARLTKLWATDITVTNAINGAVTGNAGTATALAADPADCAAGTAATAIAASGALTCGITPLISGGTLTSSNVCQYDGTGLDCDLTKDGSGDCASGAVCLGDHTHSGYVPKLDYDAQTILAAVTDNTPAALSISEQTVVGRLTGGNVSALTLDASGDCGSNAVCGGGHTHSTYLTANQSITLSGDVGGTGTTAITTTIGDNKILESMLKAVDSASDEECLTYETTTGDFEWQACGAGGLSSTDIDTSAELATILTDETGTAGNLVFSSGPTLSTPKFDHFAEVTGAHNIIHDNALAGVTTLTDHFGEYTGAHGIVFDNDPLIDHILEKTATHGVAIDGITLKDGGALGITGGTNTFNLTNGTAVLDIAAGSTLNVDANLTVESASLVNQDLTSDASPTFNQGNFTTVHGTTLEIDHIGEHTGSHTIVLDNNLAGGAGTIAAGAYGAATVDGDDVNSNIAGRSLTLTAASPDTLDADAELYTDTKCYRLSNSTGIADTRDDKSIWYAKQATTLTSVWCESDQTVNVDLQVDDDSPADVDGTDFVCDSTPPEDTSLAGDATMASGDRLDLAITSVSGTPTWFTICWTMTYDD